MKYAEMQDAVYDRASLFPASGTVPAAVTRRTNAHFNQVHRKLLGDKAFTQFRRRTLTCTSVANSPYMVTPQAMTRLVILADRVNNRTLDPMLLADIRRVDPGLKSITSFPYQFFVENYASTIAQDPTAVCQPFVVSDNAADGATTTIFLEGFITGGYYRTATVNMNGTTPVAVDSLATWISFTKFYTQKSDGTRQNATGNITLTQGSGGTELSRITPGHAYPRYTRIHLWPVPSAVNTYYADGDLHVEDLSNADDEPMIPEDFHWILVEGALALEWRFKNRLDMYGVGKVLYDEGVRDLKHWLATHPGVARSGRTPTRFSQLGSDFPANT